MQYIQTDDALKPAGHYSQAIEHNGLVYISGQFSIDPFTGKRKFAAPDEETIQILNNIEKILKFAKSDKNHILDVTIFITDMAYWDRINRAYCDFMGEHKPARCVVLVDELHYGFKVEIKAVAAVI